MMRKKILLILGLLYSYTAFSQNAEDTIQMVIKSRKNTIEQQKKPYVILISADGFRYDYAEKYHAEHLLTLSKKGVSAQSMIPVYPSVTFPNHYSIATGLYPTHHGIVGNRFYDRNLKQSYSFRGKISRDGNWYKGTPLWVLAEQQHLLSANFYWVGSDADIKGIFPTYYYKYNENIGIHKRIQTVVNWLKLPAETRPHLITFYLPEVDEAGHKYGPESAETRKQVLFIDSAVHELNKAVKATGLPVNFVFVSDHGMTAADIQHPIALPAVADSSKFILSQENVLVHLYARDTSIIKSTYDILKKQAKDYDVYLRSNTPTHWHYGLANDRYNRIGDILLVSHWPKIFEVKGHKLNPGTHGYDPKLVKDMNATFYAWGPAFKQNITIKPFENINIYPMIIQILDLTYTDPIDGDQSLAREVLKK